jgi:hypothetical protein
MALTEINKAKSSILSLPNPPPKSEENQLISGLQEEVRE